MGSPLSISLAELQNQNQALREEVGALAAGLEPTLAERPPGPGRWSVAECVAHLAVTNDLYRPALTAAIQGARTGADVGSPSEAPDSFPLGWLARRMIASIEPPPRMRLKAPPAFRPARAGDNEESAPDWPAALEAYQASNAHFAELLHQSRGLDLSRLRIASPASRLIRMRVSTAFAFLAAHDRRHLWQASQVVEALTPPSPR